MSDFAHAGRPGLRGGSMPSKMEGRGLSISSASIKTRLSVPLAVGERTYAARVYAAGQADHLEHVVVWNRKGDVYDATGNVNGISTGKQDFEGASMVHNHPTGSSFSGADLRTAQKMGLASTSVVDDKFVYTLTPGAGRGTFSDVPDDAASLWEQLFNELTGEHGTGYDEESSHTLMQKVAEKTGMQYSRRAR